MKEKEEEDGKEKEDKRGEEEADNRVQCCCLQLNLHSQFRPFLATSLAYGMFVDTA